MGAGGEVGAGAQAESGLFLSMEPRHVEMVRAILREHVPGRRVWAFGSRATGGRILKQYSDLDLAVEGTLSLSERGRLADAFDESLLPIKVDVVLGSVDAEFRGGIEGDFVRVVG